MLRIFRNSDSYVKSRYFTLNIIDGMTNKLLIWNSMYIS